MTREEIFEELKALVIAYTGVKPDKVTRESRLLSDFGLDGDDASGFMAAFTNKFDVDMSGFYWLRYFQDEGWSFLEPSFIAAARLNKGFDERWRAALAEEREITLEHLIDVAEAKKWIHPTAEATRTQKPSRHRTIIGYAAVLPVLAFAVFGLIMLYGLVIGALGKVSLVTAATAVVMTAFPLGLTWAAYTSIKRKLASGSSAAG